MSLAVIQGWMILSSISCFGRLIVSAFPLTIQYFNLIVVHFVSAINTLPVDKLTQIIATI